MQKSTYLQQNGFYKIAHPFRVSGKTPKASGISISKEESLKVWYRYDNSKTCIKQLFNVKNVCKNVKNQHVINWTYGLFGKNYRVATLFTFSLTVSGIIIPSLKVIGQF